MSLRETFNQLHVLGNGPSLKAFDFESLRGQDWIGMNAAYRHWERIKFYPSHYCCLDDEVGLSHISAIEKMVQSADALGIRRFLLADSVVESSSVLSRSEKVLVASDVFGDDQELTSRITTGSHSLLWGAKLGYDSITLLGIDLNYDENVAGLEDRGGAKLEVVKTNASPNYFFDDYQRVGDRLNRPNPVANVHTLSWRRVIRKLKSDFPHVKIENASPYSKIPGVQSSASNGCRTDYPEIIDVRLSEKDELADCIHQILPSRFYQIDDSKAAFPSKFHWLWKTVKSQNASHQGRWHIQVVKGDPVEVRPYLGSYLWLASLSECDGKDFIEQFRLYDQIIRIWSENGEFKHLSAILAMRLDIVIDHARPYTFKAARVAKLQKTSSRFIWQIIRKLDWFRASR